jgi:hypothetical protein
LNESHEHTPFPLFSEHFFIEEAFLEGDLSFVEKMPKIVELRLDFNPGLKGVIPATIAVASTLGKCNFD